MSGRPARTRNDRRCSVTHFTLAVTSYTERPRGHGDESRLNALLVTARVVANLGLGCPGAEYG